MDFEAVKKDILIKFSKQGIEKFYKSLLFSAINNLMLNNDLRIELDYLNLHDKFMVLYRREGIVEYLTLASLFRRAGNKIYRYRLKQGLCDRNNKFLNVV